MNIISLNVGLPRDVLWHGRTVTTCIYKQPIQGRVRLRTLNLDGDRQADLTVHGGTQKAVYCYPIEHYDYWKKELPGVAACNVWRKLHDRRLVGKCSPSWRSVSDRLSTSGRDPASPSLLQARLAVRVRRYGEALPRQWPHRFLLCRHPRRGSRRRR